MKHKFLLVYSWFIKLFFSFLPDAPLFMKLRGWLYSFGMKSCGKNFQVAHNVILNTLENISVGKDVYIAPNTILLGSGEIIIENEVLIGPNTVISSGNHTRANNSFRFGQIEVGKVIIKSGSWVAANCSIVSGGILPKGSVLAANSVLNKVFETPNCLYGGVPAKLINRLI